MQHLYDAQSFTKPSDVANSSIRQKGPTNRIAISVTLEDLYLGGKKIIKVTRNVYCKQCRGSGAEGGEFSIC